MKGRSLPVAGAVLMVSFACAGQSPGGSLPPVPMTIVEEDATLSTQTGTIAGTIELPAARFPVPVVLIISGSGPTDRNGNSAALPGPNNSLKMIADGLASSGIASLRYDKRGIGESRSAAQSEENLRFDHFVKDAADWIRHLRADKRFSTITVAGHSEGSLIGMIAAREAGADGYVAIAGVGRKAQEILNEQLAVQLPPAALAQAGEIMAKIEKGEKPDNVPPFLNALFRPSVQPYLKSWFSYSPEVEIAKLEIPVLILQGSTDLQVKVDDAKRLARAKPDAKLVILDGMNHVLKSAGGPIGEQLPSYSDPTRTVVPVLLDEIVAFVRSLPRR